MHIDVLLNLTPADRFAGSSRVQDVNLSVLIPVVKLLSQVKWSDAQVNIEMVDLTRNLVVYRQENINGIDWERARVRLGVLPPGVIDVKSLENHKYTGDFFVNEISFPQGFRAHSQRRTPRSHRAEQRGQFPA